MTYFYHIQRPNGKPVLSFLDTTHCRLNSYQLMNVKNEPKLKKCKLIVNTLILAGTINTNLKNVAL